MEDELRKARHRLISLVRAVPGAELSDAADEMCSRSQELLRDYDRLLQRNIELTLALDSARIGTWIWRIGGREPELVSHYAVARLFGLSEEEWALRRGDFFDLVPEEDRERVRRAFREGVRVEVEIPIVRPSGERCWLLAKGQSLPGSDKSTLFVAGTIQDVTERKATDERLRDAEAKYQALIEQLPAIVYIVKLDRHGAGRTTYISPQVEPILGYTAEEWLADPDLWWKIIPEDRRQQVRTEIDDKDRDPDRPQRITQEYPVRRKDGRVVWLRNESTTAWSRDGRVRYTDGVMIDITKGRLGGGSTLA